MEQVIKVSKARKLVKKADEIFVSVKEFSNTYNHSIWIKVKKKEILTLFNLVDNFGAIKEATVNYNDVGDGRIYFGIE